MSEQFQSRVKTALERYFRKRSLTRITLSSLFILTGLFGFLISSLLLHLGVNQMWIRYPGAVIGAYGFFLALIRIWVEIEQSRFDPHAAEIQEAIRGNISAGETQTREHEKDVSWTKWLDGCPDLLFTDAEGCAPIFGACLAIGLLIALIFSLSNIPTLLADGFLDTFLVVGLYRRLRIAAKEHWLGTTIKKTWSTAILIAVTLAFAGWILQNQAPECHSIGPAIQRALDPKE